MLLTKDEREQFEEVVQFVDDYKMHEQKVGWLVKLVQTMLERERNVLTSSERDLYQRIVERHARAIKHRSGRDQSLIDLTEMLNMFRDVLGRIVAEHE